MWTFTPQNQPIGDQVFEVVIRAGAGGDIRGRVFPQVFLQEIVARLHAKEWIDGPVPLLDIRHLRFPAMEGQLLRSNELVKLLKESREAARGVEVHSAEAGVVQGV